MILGTFGPTLPASSEKSSPSGCSSKTSLVTSASALSPCCENYGTWATRLRLAHSQRLKLARRMNASGFSSLGTETWPTPIVAEVEKGAKSAAKRARPRSERGGGDGLNLATTVSQWPTPMAGTPAQNGNSAAGNSDFSRRAEELAMWLTPDTGGGGRAMPAGTTSTGQTPDGRKVTVGLENQTMLWQTPRTVAGEYTRDKGQKGSERLTLEGEAANWSTPRASDAEKGGPNQAFGAGGTPLPAQAAQWPTPAARDWKGENSPDHLENGTGRLHMDQLPNAVAHGFSRPDLPTRKDGPTLSQLRPIWRPLRALLIASHGRATWRRLWKGRNKRRLNPGFVSWLMGWPPGHALCDCSETGFTLWQQDMRGALSQMPTASGPWIWKPVIEEPEQAQQMALF
jgi:hypothetical protein